MITEYLVKIEELYTRLKDDESLDETTIVETYNELAELTGKVTLAASELMNERAESFLEEQLKDTLAKAQAESDLIANAPMPEIVLPTKKGEPQATPLSVVDVFVAEASALVNYTKESDLPKLLPNTVRALSFVDLQNSDDATRTISEFVSVATTMKERDESFALLVPRLMPGSPMLALVDAYLSVKGSRKSMRAMGAAAAEYSKA